GSCILILNDDEYEILNNMNKFYKLKDLNCITNSRGEMDVTLHKDFIKRKKSKYPIVRGRNIGRYKFSKDDINEYAEDKFSENIPKYKYVIKNRIVCQQISNINKKQRLSFGLVPPNYILANSCNFITVEENNYNITLYYLLGLLNSRLLNWYFKLFSSNNHINKYEIDMLPIPTQETKIIKKIDSLVKQNIENEYSEERNSEINALVESLFLNENKKTTLKYDDLKQDNSKTNSPLYNYSNHIIKGLNTTKSKLTNKVLDAIKDKQYKVNNNYILNNKAFKMSELDMEIRRSVPPGGNWKNIPQETMNKSKRLLGIQDSGGRTTLYGRMEYKKPSYTITTYFNRPGNGTYIHPTKDRVITMREGARLQGFNDNYYFHGNQRDILNQIGNAVPPFIGYLFGRKLKKLLNVENSIDLFSGAGGLLTGLNESGVKALIANDIYESACITLKVNHTDLNNIHGDIQLDDVKQEILNSCKVKEVDIICGGPPCQGFSLSGFRKDNDPRNQLFRDFINVVENLKPKVILFENVKIGRA